MEGRTSLRIDATLNPSVETLSLQHDQFNDSQVYELNDDCLSKIFSYLPIADRVRAERVCKQWQRVIRESWSTVKRLNLSRSTWCLPKKDGQQHVNFDILKKILICCGKYLKFLDLRYHRDLLNTDALWIVSKYCPNVKTLDLSHFPITSQIALGLSENCRDIIELSLGECQQLCEKNLSRLIRANQKLQYLSVNRSINVSGKYLTYLPATSMNEISLYNCINMETYWLNLSLRRCVNLSALTLIWCSNIDESTLDIIGELTKIVSLTFYLDIMRPMSLRAMHNIAHLVNLESLNLLHVTLVTDKLLIDISVNCKRLRMLHVNYCEAVTNRGVISLLENAQNLIILSVTGTAVTHEIFNAADEISKQRKNDELSIFYSRKNANEPKFQPTSSFLRIIYEEYY